MPASSTTPKTSRRAREPIAALTLAVDGAARGNPGPAGAGIVVRDAKGKVVGELSVFLGETTNNVAEYSALLSALAEAARRGARRVMIQTDSELMARQIDGAYRVKDPTLKVLHALAHQLLQGFDQWHVRHVPREQNRAADRLANRAVDAGLRTARRGSQRPASPLSASQQTFQF